MLTRSTSRRISWIVLAVVAVVALVFGAVDEGGARSNAERAAALAGSIACPQCAGQPVSESNAPIAETIRAEIARQVDAGLSDAEIRAYYVGSYGEWVDLNPSRSGLTAVVWVAPFLVIGLAVGALALAFSRWRGAELAGATDDDRELVAAALDQRRREAAEAEAAERAEVNTDVDAGSSDSRAAADREARRRPRLGDEPA